MIGRLWEIYSQDRPLSAEYQTISLNMSVWVCVCVAFPFTGYSHEGQPFNVSSWSVASNFYLTFCTLTLRNSFSLLLPPFLHLSSVPPFPFMSHMCFHY